MKRLENKKDLINEPLVSVSFREIPTGYIMVSIEDGTPYWMPIEIEEEIEEEKE